MIESKPNTIEPTPEKPAPIESDLVSEVRAYAEQRPGGAAPRATEVAEMSVLLRGEPTPLEATLYHPSLCLILQGEKEVHVGTRCMRIAAGQSVVVSHHIPILARVTEASAQRPFLAMVLNLDLSIVRGLADELGEQDAEPNRRGRGADERADSVCSPASALVVAGRDPLLLDAFGRLFGMLDRPNEIPVVAPLILREVHYRLLSADHGAMLRQLVRRRSHASRIAKAIARIRENFAEPIAVPEVARVAGMSPSTFHEHFKSVTATTPLQYQKELRLLAARELLLDGLHSVSTTAFEVGYESPSQFSREYTRKFGRSPSQDLSRS